MSTKASQVIAFVFLLMLSALIGCRDAPPINEDQLMNESEQIEYFAAQEAGQIQFDNDSVRVGIGAIQPATAQKAASVALSIFFRDAPENDVTERVDADGKIQIGDYIFHVVEINDEDRMVVIGLEK